MKRTMRQILLRKLKPVKRSPVHPSLGRRGIVVPYDIPHVEGIESANREIARWPEWKRRTLFAAFGVQE
jgi:hypothetical protein